jgi:hypothetical protein
MYRHYFYTDKNGAKVVVAVSTYAGKPVKAIAKCDPSDNYSEEKGRQLAEARCNVRVSAKRRARAKMKLREAEIALIEAQRHYEDMVHYHAESCTKYNAAINEEKTLTASL